MSFALKPYLHRRGLSVLIAFLMAVVMEMRGPVSVVAQTRELPMKFHQQNTLVWCWAATIAMVVEYTKQFDLEDCAVLSEYDMQLGGWGLCCMQDISCNRTGETWEMEDILEKIFKIQCSYRRSAIPYHEIVDEIDAQRPLIAGLRKLGGGHVVVISGYQYPSNVIVLDPLNGREIIPYATLKANWRYGIWSDTFTFSTNRSDGPSCRFVLETIRPTVPCWTLMGWSSCPGPPVDRARIVCD